MRSSLRCAVAFASCVVTTPALAIDPGVAQGWLQIEGGAVTKLTHAHVYRERQNEMRILLADRAVPESALPRITTSSISKMALDGKLRGLLIRLDPAQPKRAFITPLHVPAVKGRTAPLRKLSIAGNRVVGELESNPGDIFEIGYSVKFSAPLFSGYGSFN